MKKIYKSNGLYSAVLSFRAKDPSCGLNNPYQTGALCHQKNNKKTNKKKNKKQSRSKQKWNIQLKSLQKVSTVKALNIKLTIFDPKKCTKRHIISQCFCTVKFKCNWAHSVPFIQQSSRRQSTIVLLAPEKTTPRDGARGHHLFA